MKVTSFLVVLWGILVYNKENYIFNNNLNI